MNLDEYFMPFTFIYVEKGVPVFSLRDVNLYGQPCLFGVQEYLVIDDPTESCPFVLDYKGEQDRRGALRPIHRYSQDKRFELLLKKFLGGSCARIKNQDLFLTVAMDVNWDKNEIWNSVRKILKDNGWTRYYDYIPSILEKIGYEHKIVCGKALVVDEILNDFKKLTHGFERERLGKRKYMINFRFIALKLMERHGVVFGILLIIKKKSIISLNCKQLEKFKSLRIFGHTLKNFLTKNKNKWILMSKRNVKLKRLKLLLILI